MVCGKCTRHYFFCFMSTEGGSDGRDERKKIPLKHGTDLSGTVLIYVICIPSQVPGMHFNEKLVSTPYVQVAKATVHSCRVLRSTPNQRCNPPTPVRLPPARSA